MATRKTTTTRKSSPALSTTATRRASTGKATSSTGKTSSTAKPSSTGASPRTARTTRAASVPSGLKPKTGSVKGSPKTTTKASAAAAAWEEEKQALDEQISSLQEQLEEATAAKDQAEERLQEMPALVELLEQKEEALKAALEESQAAAEANRELKSKLSTAEDAVSRAAAKAQEADDSAFKLEELQSQLEEAQQAATESAAQLANAQELQAAALQRADELDKQLAELQAQTSDAATDALQAELADLRVAKEQSEAELQAQVDKANAKVSDLESQLTTLQEQPAAVAEGAEADVDAQLAALRSERDEAKRAAARLEAQVEELTEAASSAEEISDKLLEAEARAATLQAQVDALSKANDADVSEALARAEAKAAALQAQLDTLRASPDHSMDDAVHAAEAQAAVVRGQVGELQQQQQRHLEAVGAHDALQKLRSELESANARASSLETQVKQQAAQLSDASAAQSRVNELESQIKSLKQETASGAQSLLTGGASQQIVAERALPSFGADAADQARQQQEIARLQSEVTRLQKLLQRRSTRRSKTEFAGELAGSTSSGPAVEWICRVFFVGDTRARAKVTLDINGVDGSKCSVDLPLDMLSGAPVPVQLTVDEVETVHLTCRQLGGVGDWHLLHLELEDPRSGQLLTFPFDNWRNQSIELFAAGADEATLDRDESLIAVPREYIITTRTSDIEAGGTVSNVAIMLMGDRGDSEPTLLSTTTTGAAPFGRGQMDTFAITAASVGNIHSVRIGHDHLEDDWHLESVTVHDAEANRTYEFPCNQWFGANRDDGQTERVLSAHHPPVEIPYDLAIYTSDIENAGTDANVSITVSGKGLSGEDNANEIDFSGAPPGTFERGKVDRFGIQVISIDEPSLLRVCHDGSGDSPDWHVDKIVLENKLTHVSYEFPVNQWLTAGANGRAEYDLVAGETTLDGQEPTAAPQQVSRPASMVGPAGVSQSQSRASVLSRDVQVEVQTGSDKTAGTDAAVYIILEGLDGQETDKIFLENSSTNKKPFQRNQKDVFKVKSTLSSPLTAIRVGHDKAGLFSWWKLDSITITDGSQTFYCPFNNWIPSEEDPSLERTIVARNKGLEVPYDAWFSTADDKSGACDGNVTVTVRGLDADGADVEDTFPIVQPPKDAFAAGQRTKLPLGLLEIAVPREIALEQDGKNPWKLEQVDLVNTASGRAFSAPFSQSVEKGFAAEETFAESQEWSIKVKTSDAKHAGTDANITIRLVSENGDSTAPIPLVHSLNHSGSNRFEKGNTDEFVVFVPATEPLASIELAHDGHGSGSGWMVDTTEITSRSSGKTYAFPFNDSIPSESDPALSRIIPVRLVENEVPYNIVFHTSDQKGSHCDCLVSLDVFGSDASGASAQDSTKFFDATKQSFQQGQVTAFKRGLLSMHEVDSIIVRHDGKGKHTKWHLDQVELVNENTGVVSRFLYRDWLKKGDDGVFQCKLDAHPVIEYEVTVTTSDFAQADTSAGVEITLLGARETTPTQLRNSTTNPTPFKRGQSDKFTFEAQPVDPIHAVLLAHDGKGVAFNWHVESVTVKVPKSGTTYVFPCGDWLCDSDGTSRRQLQVRDKAAEVPYQVSVYTADEKNADTDCGVTIEVVGVDANQAPSRDVLKFSKVADFDRGTLRSFQRGIVNMDAPHTLVISHDNKGKAVNWLPEQVVLQNQRTNVAYVFPCNRWIGTGVESGQKQIEVTGFPAASYEVTTFTSDSSKNDGDSSVEVELCGTAGETGPLKLDHSLVHDKKFLRDQSDRFNVFGQDVGELTGIRLKHHSGDPRGVHFGKVEVLQRATGDRYFFECNQWVGADAGQIALQPTSKASEATAVPFKVIFETGDLDHAGTDANVSLVVFGPDHQGLEVQNDFFFSETDSGFERGHTDEREIKLSGIVAPERIKLSHDCSKSGDSWFVEKVTLVNSQTGEEYVFPCREWLSDAIGDGEVSREFNLGNLIEYKFEIKTSDIQFAGTDANVYAFLEGTKGATWRMPLDSKAKKLFERDKTDTFTVIGHDVGDITLLRLGHDGRRMNAGWHVHSVRVSSASGSEVYFPVHQWFDSEVGDKQIERVLMPRDVSLEVPYDITVVTSDDKGSSFNHADALSLTVVGRNSAGEESIDMIRFWDADKHSFASGKTTTFQRGLLEVAEVKKLRLICSRPDKWNLDRIEFKNKQTDESTVFLCRRTLFEDSDHLEAEFFPTLGIRTYELSVFTGDIKNAGTDAKVTLVLHGPNGQNSAPVRLKKSLTNKKPFQKGKTDRFEFESDSLPDITAVTIEHDGAGFASGWYLARLELNVKGDEKKFHFPLHDWIPSKDDKERKRFIPVRLVDQEVPYEIAVHVDQASGNFDDELCLQVKGLDKDGVPVEDTIRFHEADKDSFQAGKSARFGRGLVRVVKPTAVAAVSNGKSEALKLDKIDFVNQDSKESSTFYMQTHVQPRSVAAEPRFFEYENTVQYVVTCTTTDIKNGGTDSDVSISFIGEDGETQAVILRESLTHEVPFMKKNVDRFLVVERSVGKITHVRVALTHETGTWHLHSLEVSVPSTGENYAFPYHDWIPTDEDKSLERTIPARDRNAEVQYEVRVYTSDDKNGATDQEVSFVVEGEDREGQMTTDRVRLFEAKKDSFAAGQKSTFPRGLLNLVKPAKLIIGHDGTGRSVRWALQKVELKNLENGALFTFLHEDVIEKGSVVELTAKAISEYEVTVTTGEDDHASYNQAVRLTLYGEEAATPVTLRPKSDFGKGSTETFTIETDPVEPLQHIKVELDTNKTGVNWQLATIEVKARASEKVYLFPCHDWLDVPKDGPGTRARVLLLRDTSAEIPYEIQIDTSEDSEAGTDSTVYMVISGANSDGEVVSDTLRFHEAKKDSFSQRGHAVFTRGVLGVVQPQRILIGHDGSGTHNQWKLNKVVLINTQSGGVTVFPLDDWLGASAAATLHPDPVLFVVKFKKAAKNNIGFLLGEDDGALVVSKVFDGSAAAEQLKVADQLLEVEGRAVSGMTAAEATALAETSDGDLELLVARGHEFAECAELVGQEAEAYSVTFITSDSAFAGTDANVFVQLFGPEGESTPTLVQNDSGDGFESGARITTTVHTKPLGGVQRLRVRHDGSGMFSKWKLARVEVVSRNTGDFVVFDCNEELSDKDNDRLLENPTIVPRDAAVLYDVAIYTSNIDGAGTDSNVSLEVTGTDISGRECTSNFALDTIGRSGLFESGNKDEFSGVLPGITNPTRITLSHDAAKAFSDWHVEKVVLTNKSDNQTFVFPCRSWLNAENNNSVTADVSRMTFYTVAFDTSDISSAGTDALVSVSLIGQDGRETWATQLRNDLLKEEKGRTSHDRFERGSTDEFYFEAQDVSPVAKFRVSHDGNGLGSAWHLNTVRVTPDNSTETYTFVHQDWIPSAQNKSCERVLSARHVEREVPYEIRIVTNEDKGAGTTASVSLSIIGKTEDEQACSDTVQLWDADSDAFDSGKTATFERGLVDMHKPSKITVKMSKADAWNLDRIELVNKQTGEDFDFLCRAVIGETKEALEHSLSCGELVSYVVNVVTGDAKNAGATGRVILTLCGPTADEVSIPITLKTSNHKKPFQRGQTDEFQFQAEPFDDIAAIKVQRFGSHAWFLSSVDIAREGSDQPPSTFVYNWWFKDDLPVTIPKRNLELEVPYEFVIQTGDDKDGSCDCAVFIKVHGEDQDGQAVEDEVRFHEAKKGDFAAGNEAKFERGLLSMARPTRIEVTHDNSGKRNNWLLETVTLQNASTAENFIFVCRDWVRPDGTRELQLTDVTEYLLSVSTTDIKHAGTDGPVEFTFYGPGGEVKFQGTRSLTHKKKYQAGNVDKFKFVDKPIGNIERLHVQHHGHNAWHLAEVELAEVHSGRTLFPFHDWIPSEADNSRERELVPRPVEREVPYTIAFVTADNKNAGCDCGVSMEVTGLTEGGQMVIETLRFHEATRDSFTPGSRTEFSRGLLDMVTPESVSVSHDNRGKHKAWQLLKVTLINQQTGTPYNFAGDGVIGEGPDAETSRDLPLSDLVEYTAEVRTSNEKWSGTNAGVKLQLTGTHGSTGEVSLKRSQTNKHPFQQGQNDVFNFDEKEIGAINELLIEHDGSGRAPDWRLDSVDVVSWWEGPSQSRRYHFPCNEWLNEDCNMKKTLIWDQNVPYTLKLETADEPDAGTLANVFLTVFGRSWDGADRSDVVKLAGDKKALNPGETAEFQINVSDIAWPCLVEVGHNGRGDGSRWALTKVTLINEHTRESFVFPCNETIDSALDRVSLALEGTDPEVTVREENGQLATSPAPLFYPWKCAPRPGTDAVLNAVASYLQQTDHQLEVTGFCNGSRTSEGLQALALERAEFAVQYLAQQGVDRSRLTARSGGCSVANPDNARVQFTIRHSHA